MRILRSRLSRIAVVLVLVGAVVAFVAAQRSNQLTIQADFERSTGLYVGSDVRIMGVKVGKVTEVTPSGDHVRVTMVLTEHTDVPADAKAALVAPSLVSGRYVQLAPAYTGGPKLADDATIPRERTAVPVEWDDIKEQLTRITTAIAPRNGKRNGSLSRFVESAAGALRGNGSSIRDTIGAMSDASQTLAGNKDNLFVTVSNLADFIQAMNQSGEQIESFAAELASISEILGSNRKQLAGLLRQSRLTVKSVRGFVTTNRDALDEGVGRVTALSNQLASKQVELANILHLAPTTLANFYNSYDPSTGAMTARPVFAETMGFANVVCQAIFSAGGTLEDCQKNLGPLLDPFNMEFPLSANPIQQDGVSNQVPRTDRRSPSAAPATPERAPDTPERGDLAGLTHLLLGGPG